MLHSGKGGAVLNTFDKDACCTQEQREALELCGVVASRAKERKAAPDQRGLTSGTKSNPQSSPCTGFARVAQTSAIFGRQLAPGPNNSSDFSESVPCFATASAAEF